MKKNLSNDLLQTPKYITDALGGVFDLDPCAGYDTKIGKVNLWGGRGEDGLLKNWDGLVFLQSSFFAKRSLDFEND